MVDHQIAHIYVKEGFMNQSKRVLENIEGIDKVVYGSEQKNRLNIDHERSGEIIAISDRDKWFSYYWWYDAEKLLILQELLIYTENQGTILLSCS